MTTKTRFVLYDSLYILYFVLVAGWIFSILNMMVFFIGLPLLLLPSALIRPHGYKIGKTKGVILVLIFSVMVISGLVAYCLGVKPSIDDALCILLPTWFQLMLGCGFVAAAVVMLSKLLQDLKVS
jgi:hypothetical protein